MHPEGGAAASLYRDVFQEVLGRLGGLSLPPPPEDLPTLDVPLPGYQGRYQRLSTRYDLGVEDGALVLTATGRKPPMSLLPPARSTLRAVAPDTFVVEQPTGLLRSPVLFSHFDESGRPRYLHVGLRATPRVAHGRETP